jgi:Cu/Ag efflux protein CusF
MQQSGKSLHRRLFLLAAGGALAGAFGSQAALGASLGEERITALRGTVTGQVTALDPATRVLTLRLPRGETAYRVDPKVQTLGSIKVGDTVRVTYGAVIGITLRRASTKPAASAAQGEGKGPAAGERIKGELRVLSLDAASQMVRLQGPKGAEADFHVRDKADLANVRVGDRVIAVIYELSAGDVVLTTK